MKYGYIRVSTDNQDFIRQESIMASLKLDEIIEEKISGKKAADSRPAFQNLLTKLTVGDSIYFESMSRMGRNLANLIETSNFLVKEKKVNVYFLKENITLMQNSNDFNSSMTNLIFNIMGAFAQFERDLIADRTRETLQAKKEQGIILGRPTNNVSDEELKAKYTAKTPAGTYLYTIDELVALLGLSKPTIINRMKKLGITRNKIK